MKDFLSDLPIWAFIFAILLIIGLVFGLAALEVWICMLLWNGVLCAVFTAIPTISFWHMWGLLILFHLLFASSHIDFGKKKD